MRQNKRAQSSRGFFLIDVIGGVILLSAFILLSSVIFVQVVRIQRNAWQSVPVIERLDGAVERLRRDVWSAHGVEVVNGRQLVVIQDGQKKVMWTSDEAGNLKRSEEGEKADLLHAQSWGDLPVMTFVATGPGVDVTLTPRVSAEGNNSAVGGMMELEKPQTLSMVSQVLLEKGR